MRWLLFCCLLIPTFVMAWELFYAKSVIDPIQYIYTVTGSASIILLFVVTTLSMIKKRINLIKYRRQIGLFAFYYALLHFLNFIVLDMQVDFVFALNESIEKPFVFLGALSFLILILMSLTSSKRLFARYNKYHKAIYLVLVLSTIHFIMAQKSLSIEQYFYLVCIGIVLVLKVKQQMGLKNSYTK